ncbi:MAG: transposase [Nitrosomonas sp. H1_AOB3]|nr:MAG: transposase [Nitrosomonas sp. H1_AOB3]
MIPRKQYSKEFKLDAVSLVLEQGYTRAEAARSLEINISQLGRWIREYREDSDGQAFRGNGKLTLEQEEIRKLKVRVKQLEMEKHILGSDGLLRQRNELKYSFITQKKKTCPVGLMCQLLGVTRSGYYGYLKRNTDKPDDARYQTLLEVVREIAESSDNTYGSRRMKQVLNARSYPVSRSKVRKLMIEAGVQAKQRKRYREAQID